MIEPRKTGWQSLGWFVILLPFTGTTYLLAHDDLFSPMPVLFVVLCVCELGCLFTAVWGLWLGYNQAAWRRHVDSENRETADAVERMRNK